MTQPHTLKYPRFANTPRLIDILHESLTNFGYKVTTEYVSTQFNLVQAGDTRPADEGGITIIGMMIEKQLKDASR